MDDVVAPVQLAWAAPATRLIVQAGAQAAAAAGLALGVLLGTVPCRAVFARDRAALWLGPDEWLVLAPDGEAGLAEQSVAAASIVDVSHGWRGIDIAGPRAAWCINAFNPLDLDAATFPVGACSRTIFGKAQIVLWRTGAELFRLEVARSSARYVWACLEEARLEFMPRG